MALVQAVQIKPKLLPLAEERRRFQRVRVNLLGRYMLSDRQEYPCQVANLPEDRRDGRITPRNPVTHLAMPNGMNMTCRIIDLSLSGAAVLTDQRPAIGMLVMLGKIQGRVVRHLEDGFAVEFTRLQHPDFLEESVCGP
jgi:hypothetical protein